MKNEKKKTADTAIDENLGIGCLPGSHKKNPVFIIP